MNKYDENYNSDTKGFIFMYEELQKILHEIFYETHDKDELESQLNRMQDLLRYTYENLSDGLKAKLNENNVSNLDDEEVVINDNFEDSDDIPF